MLLLTTTSPPQLGNREVVEYGGWIPVGIHVIVRLQERSSSRPKFAKERNKVLRIGSQPCIELGNRYVSDFELLPGLRFKRFEYLIERLFLGCQDEALLREYCL